MPDVTPLRAIASTVIAMMDAQPVNFVIHLGLANVSTIVAALWLRTQIKSTEQRLSAALAEQHREIEALERTAHTNAEEISRIHGRHDVLIPKPAGRRAS